MEVWAVLYKAEDFSEDLYQRALRMLDPESSARIKRFYFREDACRTLIGRLLVRKLLKRRGITSSAMTFSATASNKPYITTPGLNPPVAYNVSHDNGLIAMAFAPGLHNPPAFNIGIDVMKVRIPGRNTLASFVESVSDQLTPYEYHRLFTGISQAEILKQFFWLWTMKEAYTKALGLGLGFDFRRIEYDVSENVVRVDKERALGWRFTKFVFTDENDLYQGVVAEYIGGKTTEIIDEMDSQKCVLSRAVPFVETVLHELDDV